MAVNTIPLPEAEVWQANWIASESLANDPSKIRSFLIPIADLQQVINEMGVANARGVLGITPEGEYKFMLVGVDNNGQTMVNPIQGQHVYDFTQPCPPDCGTGPLSGKNPLI
jgi:hypothetical protein